MIGLARTASRLSKALDRLFAPAPRLDGLKVMVLGLGDHVSREVVWTLSRQKAKLTVVGDAAEVELMSRDLELLGVVATPAPLEAIDATEAQLMADHFRALGQLPNVIVCCSSDADAAVSVLLQALQPTLTLQLRTARPGPSAAGLAPGACAARSFAALLDDPGLFDPARPLPKVRLGARLFDVRRREPVFAAPAARRRTGRPAERSKPARRPAAAKREPLPPTRPAQRFTQEIQHEHVRHS
jgi:hypothetical protein